MDVARLSPGRFLPDAARQDGQEWVEDKIERSAQDRQVSPDALWVNSLGKMLLLARLRNACETKLISVLFSVFTDKFIFK